MSTIPNGYKQTEVGVIPSDWEVRKLGDIGEVKMCRRVFSHETQTSGLIPFYKIGTFGKEPDAYISTQLYNNYRQRFSFPNIGDILISAAGTIGRTLIYDGKPSYFQDSNIVWIENDESLVSNKFLYQVFKVVKYNTEGGTIQRLYNSILKSTKFLNPPTKTEQTAIATALSDADALITQLEKLIDKKRKIKQGAMQELLRPKEGWEVKTLGDVADKIIGGGTPSRSNKEYWGGEIPWVTVKDFATFNPYSSQEFITKEGLKNSASHLIPKRTLITSTRMAVGKVLIYEVDVSINQDLKAIFHKPNIDLSFLYYWFLHKTELFENMGSGSTVMGISLVDLKSIEIILPSKDEQTRIAQILTDMDAEIEQLEKKLEKYKMMKQGMMQNLLTGKIRLV